MNTTQNGLMMPFLGLLRGLLDNDGAREVLPMFDAFAEDVKRMAVACGNQEITQAVGDLAIADLEDEVRWEEAVEKALYDHERKVADNLALALGLNPEVTLFDLPNLIERVRERHAQIKHRHEDVCSALGVSTASPEAHWDKLIEQVRSLVNDKENLDQDLTMARAVIDRMPDKAEKPVNIPIEDDKELPAVIVPKGCSGAPKIEEKELGWPWTFHPDTARELVFEALRKTPFKGIAYLWKELPDALSFLEANRLLRPSQGQRYGHQETRHCRDSDVRAWRSFP